MRTAWALAFLTSCTVSVSLEGKRCAAVEPRCLPGYVCVDDFCVTTPGSDGGTDDAGTTDAGATCPLDTDPAANACTGTTWYLSPTGSDSNDGKSASTPRLTIPSAATRGDTVHLLGGSYAQAPSPALGMSGNAACPFVVEGEPDGGTVLQGTLELEGAYLVFRHLVFSPRNANAVNIYTSANHVTFQWCTFRSRPPTSGFPTDLQLNDACDDCVVRECSFESPDGVQPINANGARFAFRGNKVRVAQGAGPSFVGASPVIEGNDFTGEWSETPYLDLGGSTNGRVSRNVFHDLSAYFPDKLLIGGAVRVSHNTFSNIVGNDNVALVGGVARFDNNLVTNAQWVVEGRAPDAGDYNLFDPSVLRPYSDFDGGLLNGTDRIASVVIDTANVPLAGSAAIDAADPSNAVPPGGGARADIGARERGATLLPDGRYCLTDGGL